MSNTKIYSIYKHNINIFYLIFEWKHDSYGKYKHGSCFIKIGLYSTYAKRKITLY